MKITGYGRGWQEEKQNGIKRLFQICREPAGFGTYLTCSFILFFVLSLVTLSSCQSRQYDWSERNLDYVICHQERLCEGK